MEDYSTAQGVCETFVRVDKILPKAEEKACLLVKNKKIG